MLRITGGMILAALLLYGQSYEKDLETYLSSKTLPLSGKFYMYDFNHDGKYAYNDWLYIVITSGNEYRLLGTIPTPSNPFGWLRVDVPKPSQEPNGYFVKLPDCYCDSAMLGTNAFSWVYITQGRVYKLMGANPDHTFRYYDRDGDGQPDPLANISYTILDGYVSFVNNTTVQNPPSIPEYTNAEYRVFAWNDLGMHCMDNDYSVFSILPPYNTLHTQVIKTGAEPQKLDNVTLTYRSLASLDGKLNTTSSNKVNFWEYVEPLFHTQLQPNEGLKGFYTPTLNPQTMQYNNAYKWYSAEGIPITPYNDDKSFNPYPMVEVRALDSNGNLLATTTTVLPVSTEMNCKACHASNANYPGTKPIQGYVNLSDEEKDYRYNILRLHDQEHPNAVADNANKLAQKGYHYNLDGLEATAKSGTPVLCAACHKSNALEGSGVADVPPLTQAIHSAHANAINPKTGKRLNEENTRTSCYMCHPGFTTQCLRGAMGETKDSNGHYKIECQSCHGNMSAVGRRGREGWLDEPGCQHCHQDGKRYTSAVVDMTRGTLRDVIDNRFATTANVPAPNKSLYRFSKGHGGMKCSACHGSPHAIYPTSRTEDNIQNMTHQGYAGTLSKCSVCHQNTPWTVNEGPHGLHTIGQRWVDEHGDIVEHSGSNSCAACHGKDFKGSPLSKTFEDRTFNVEEYGTKSFIKGHQVSCYDCHNGPGGEDEYENEDRYHHEKDED